MKKKSLMAATIVMALQSFSCSFVAAADRSDAPDQTVPIWVYQAVDDLAKAGIVNAAAGGTYDGVKLSRDEAATLVARAILKTEASAGHVEQHLKERGASEADNAARVIAHLEEMEAQARQWFHKTQEEYVKAEKELDFCAMQLAEAELADVGLANLEKTEEKYRRALRQLGEITHQLAQAEIGMKERGLYIEQLKEQKRQARLDQNATRSQPKGQSNYTAGQRETVERLKKEFIEELTNMGYGAIEFAEKPLKPTLEEQKFIVSGEVRYNYADNEGPRKTIADDSRLRTRIYGKAQLGRYWSAYTMVESDKSFLQDKRDGRLKWNRFYLQGIDGNHSATAGSFGYLIAEGNVYDSTFKGAIFGFGDPIKYKVGYGHTNENGNGFLAAAAYKTQNYNVEGGFYRYRDGLDKKDRTIAYMGGNYFLGRYSLGAMYLRSSLHDSAGDADGYVLTANYGALKVWRPGSYSFFLKYYDQANGTYIAHTMTGPAGYMEGFKGFGGGLYYTVAEDWVYGIEYYNLQDKVTGVKGKTLWNQITYYF